MKKYTMQSNNLEVRDKFLEKLKNTKIDTISFFAPEHNKDSMDGSIWPENSADDIEHNLYENFQYVDDVGRGGFQFDPQNEIYLSKNSDPVIEILNNFGDGVESYNNQPDGSYILKYIIGTPEGDASGKIQCRQDLQFAVEAFFKLYVMTKGEATFRFTQ